MALTVTGDPKRVTCYEWSLEDMSRKTALFVVQAEVSCNKISIFKEIPEIRNSIILDSCTSLEIANNFLGEVRCSIMGAFFQVWELLSGYFRVIFGYF